MHFINYSARTRAYLPYPTESKLFPNKSDHFNTKYLTVLLSNSTKQYLCGKIPGSLYIIKKWLLKFTNFPFRRRQ